jgi:hypothetical protein
LVVKAFTEQKADPDKPGLKIEYLWMGLFIQHQLSGIAPLLYPHMLLIDSWF